MIALVLFFSIPELLMESIEFICIRRVAKELRAMDKPNKLTTVTVELASYVDIPFLNSYLSPMRVQL